MHLIRMYDCYIIESNFYMILDLSALFLCKYKFDDVQIKNLIYQLLSGLSFLHNEGIIHRDVKSSNILLTRTGCLKIADFGLSKPECSEMTNQVCTLWYRAPELLLGESKYDNRIDSWSVGCILVEFKTHTPVFTENDEISQIKKIFKVLGTPKKEYRYSKFFEQSRYLNKKPWNDIINDNFSKYLSTDLLHLTSELLKLDFDE